MRNTILKYGLTGGAILSFMMAATVPFHDTIGFEYGALVGYTSMVLAFLAVYFGVRSYRDRIANGLIGFGRALGVGVSIALVVSACYVATWQVVYFGFMPDFGDKYIEYALKQARESGKSEAEVASMKSEMDAFMVSYQNPLYNAAITFIEPLPVGLLFAFGSAIVLRRRKLA